METISEDERLFIREILRHGDCFRVGESLVNNLFGHDGIALFLLDDGTACILAASSESEKVKKSKQKLFTLMALMEDLERDNMIVCFEGKHKLALYMSSGDTSLAVDRNRYTFNGGVIEDEKSKFVLKMANDGKLMSGVALARPVSEKLYHFVASEIFATSRLQELSDNNFQSVEALRYEKEISYANKSLRVSWAAFFVALVSVFVNVPISNKWGRSTIDTSQYINITNSITGIREEVQMVNRRIDSIFTICDEGKTEARTVNERGLGGLVGKKNWKQ